MQLLPGDVIKLGWNGAKQLAKFFVAAESDPREYIGPANDPDNPEVVAWHRAFINVD